MLTTERHDRDSLSSELTRASRVTCSKRAVCADDRGSIRRNRTRKPIKDARPSAIVIGVISLDLDVNNLANNENTDHHHGHPKVDDVQTGGISEENLFVIPIHHADHTEHDEGRNT